MKKVLDYMLKYSFLLIYFGIFLLCIVGVKFIKYKQPLDISKNNWFIFIISLVIFILVLGIVNKLSKLLSKNTKIIVLATSLLFIVQVILMYYYYFGTGWDVRSVLSAAEKLAASGELKGQGVIYFSSYPNNLFITILFSKIIAFCNFIGLGNYFYFIILVLQSILNVGTGLLLYLTLKKVLNNNYLAWVGYILYILLIWLSPWVSIPYSESMGVIFPILILYIYANMKTQYIYIYIYIYINNSSFDSNRICYKTTNGDYNYCTNSSFFTLSK